MIDDILREINDNMGATLSKESGIDEAKIPEALQYISSTVMAKAKGFMDNGKIMELKDIFTSEDESDKEAFMNETQSEIISKLKEAMGLEESSATTLTNLSIPEIIRVSKEKLLGPDGKIGFADIPRLMSFFKSEGKNVSSGGLGGMFGF